MIRIILLLTAYTSLANKPPVIFHKSTAPHPNTTTTIAARTRSKTTKLFPTIERKTIEEKTIEKIFKDLHEDVDEIGLDVLRNDMKQAWDKIMKDGQGEPSRDMIKLLNLLKDIVKDYNLGLKDDYKDLESAWAFYMSVFGKEYKSEEVEMRKAIFKKNKEFVQKHNELYRKGNVSYSVKLNHLSDRTHRELEKLKGYRLHRSTQQNFTQHNFTQHPHPRTNFAQENDTKYYHYTNGSTVPPSVDWREQSYVTSVKFQGYCSSCYAFAGIGALEGYYKRKTGKLITLSVQNILDCTWHLGNRGCDGGFINLVFDYASSNGIELNLHYPYIMNASYNCQWEKKLVAATAEDHLTVPLDDEIALKHAVANYGPVAAVIGTSGIFYKYDRGVFDPSCCGSASQSVLIVGYGTDPKHGDYWIIKNSYGKWWGEDGYIRLARNKNNLCHVASHAVFLV